MPNGYPERHWRKKLCGAAEIAEFAGVTPQLVSYWLTQEWFPKPLDEPRMGRVWDYEEVTRALSAKGYPNPSMRFKRRNLAPEPEG